MCKIRLSSQDVDQLKNDMKSAKKGMLHQGLRLKFKLNFIFNDGTLSNTPKMLSKGPSEFMPEILLQNALISWFCLKAFLEGIS